MLYTVASEAAKIKNHVGRFDNQQSCIILVVSKEATNTRKRCGMTEKEKQILCSSLYEYVSQRMCPTVEAYIEKRYPVGEYSESFLQAKKKDVSANIVIAEQLRVKLLKGNYVD